MPREFNNLTNLNIWVPPLFNSRAPESAPDPSPGFKLFTLFKLFNSGRELNHSNNLNNLNNVNPGGGRGEGSGAPGIQQFKQCKYLRASNIYIINSWALESAPDPSPGCKLFKLCNSDREINKLNNVNLLITEGYQGPAALVGRRLATS